ncbi:MAG: hypothetical protein WA118_03530 [Carboxydocellales bacterium]
MKVPSSELQQRGSLLQENLQREGLDEQRAVKSEWELDRLAETAQVYP